MGKKDLEAAFAQQIKTFGLPEPETQYRFHSTRRWRFDFAYPKQKVAVEIQGGIWTNGGHTRGSGYLKDCEKFNWANRLGWCLLLVPINMVNDYTGVYFLKEVLDGA